MWVQVWFQTVATASMQQHTCRVLCVSIQWLGSAGGHWADKAQTTPNNFLRPPDICFRRGYCFGFSNRMCCVFVGGWRPFIRKCWHWTRLLFPSNCLLALWYAEINQLFYSRPRCPKICSQCVWVISCAHLHVHIYIYMCMSLSLYIYICICVYIYTYTHTCVYIWHMYIYIYIYG